MTYVKDWRPSKKKGDSKIQPFQQTGLGTMAQFDSGKTGKIPH
jgi:hypothetical protein